MRVELRNTKSAMQRKAISAGRAALLSISLSVSLGLGCGGAAKGSAATGGTTPSAANTKPTDFVGAKKPKRDISTDARKDYEAAIEYFKQQESAGWNEDRCRSSADRFSDVASKHSKLIEARYMAGLSYHLCGMDKDAEKQYQMVLEANPSHAQSLSNLGELSFKAGKVDVAKDYWQKSVKAEGRMVAARSNLAWLLLQQMRTTTDRAAWAKLEEQARDHLSNALAVNSELVKTYVLYALIYLEGSDRNRNRLDLAKILLDEGAERDQNYAPLYNARGLLHMKRQNQGEALTNFEKAVTLDENFVEARLNVGNISLGFRKYDVAEQQFSKVLSLSSTNYDAQVGLGIAQRGLGKLDDAEASYQKAVKLDPNKGAAHFNLGVLYKDFRANSMNDLKQSKKAYETAREHFKTYISKPGLTEESKKEANDNIADCDKIIKQLDEVIKATEQAGGG